MSISDIDNKIIGTIVKVCPRHVIDKGEKAVTTIGHFSTPANRLIMGATALAFQPYIDYHNKDVDERTRKVSTARTVAKILAGTFSGFLVRKGCIKLIDFASVKNMAELNKMGEGLRKNLAKTLIPNEKVVSNEKYFDNFRMMKKHKEAIGSCMALLAMIITNFVFDVPVTKYLTNKFVDKFVDKKSPEDKKGGNV